MPSSSASWSPHLEALISCGLKPRGVTVPASLISMQPPAGKTPSTRAQDTGRQCLRELRQPGPNPSCIITLSFLIYKMGMMLLPTPKWLWGSSEFTCARFRPGLDIEHVLKKHWPPFCPRPQALERGWGSRQSHNGVSTGRGRA